jgi:lysophospholipase L1-like esterase
VNKGVVGASLDNLLAGTGGYTRPWTQEMAASPADIVVFNFGINDGHQTGMTVQKFDAEVRETVSVGQAAGKLMVIETSNPITQNPDVLLPQLAADEQLIAVQLHVPIVDQFAYLSKLDWSPYLSDGVHPTAAGYDLKANYTASILGPILMTQGCF